MSFPICTLAILLDRRTTSQEDACVSCPCSCHAVLIHVTTKHTESILICPRITITSQRTPHSHWWRLSLGFMLDCILILKNHSSASQQVLQTPRVSQGPGRVDQGCPGSHSLVVASYCLLDHSLLNHVWYPLSLSAHKPYHFVALLVDIRRSLQ